VNKVTITIEGELQSAIKTNSRFQELPLLKNAFYITEHILVMSAMGIKPTVDPRFLALDESALLLFFTESLLKRLHRAYKESDFIEVKLCLLEKVPLFCGYYEMGVGFAITFFTTGGVEKLLVLTGQVDFNSVFNMKIE